MKRKRKITAFLLCMSLCLSVIGYSTAAIQYGRQVPVNADEESPINDELQDIGGGENLSDALSADDAITDEDASGDIVADDDALDDIVADEFDGGTADDVIADEPNDTVTDDAIIEETDDVVTDNVLTDEDTADEEVSEGTEEALDDEPAYYSSTDGDIRVSKTANKDNALLGETVDYTVVVENTGTSPISMTFSDNMADDGLKLQLGTSFVDGTYMGIKASSESEKGFVLENDINIEAGGSVTVTYSATVVGIGDGGSLVNTATALVNGMAYSDSYEIALIRNPELYVDVNASIEGLDDGEVRPGDIIDYTVIIRNDEPDDSLFGAMDLNVDLDLAGGQLQLEGHVNVNANGTDTEYTELSFPVSLKAGESVIITYKASVKSNVMPGMILINKATATLLSRGYSVEESATLQVEANLEPSVVKTAERSEALAGMEVTYNVDITNNFDPGDNQFMEDINLLTFTGFRDDLANGLELIEDSVEFVNISSSSSTGDKYGFTLVKNGNGFELKLNEPLYIKAGKTLTVSYTVRVPESAVVGREYVNTAWVDVEFPGELIDEDGLVQDTYEASYSLKVSSMTARITESELATTGKLVAILSENVPDNAVYTWYEVPRTLVPLPSGYQTLYEDRDNTKEIYRTVGNPGFYVFDADGNLLMEAPNKYYVVVSWTNVDGKELSVTSMEYSAHYYSEVKNSSFEMPVLDSKMASMIIYQNDGQFNKAETAENGGGEIEGDVGSSLDFVWQSTSGNFELVTTKSYRDNGSYLAVHFQKNPSMPDGNQCAEVNADSEGTLYQPILVQPGTIIHWGLSHRGRAGKDTLGIYIGDLNPATNEIPYDDHEHFITDNDQWRFYSGEYVVPEGQYVTYFCMTSIDTAARIMGAFSEGKTIGNLIDYVQVTAKEVQYPPIIVSPGIWVRKQVVGPGGTFTFSLDLIEGNPEGVYLVDMSKGNTTTWTGRTIEIELGNNGTGATGILNEERYALEFVKPGRYVMELKEINIPSDYACDTGSWTIVFNAGFNEYGGYGCDVEWYRDGVKIENDNNLLLNGNCPTFKNYYGYEFDKTVEETEALFPGEAAHYTSTIKHTTDNMADVEFKDDLAGGDLILVEGSVKVTLDGEEYDFGSVIKDGTGFKLERLIHFDGIQTAVVTYTAVIRDNPSSDTIVNTATAKAGNTELTSNAVVKCISLTTPSTGGMGVMLPLLFGMLMTCASAVLAVMMKKTQKV